MLVVLVLLAYIAAEWVPPNTRVRLTKIGFSTISITLWKMLCTIFYSLVELYQKTQLVNKNRTRAFTME